MKTAPQEATGITKPESINPVAWHQQETICLERKIWAPALGVGWRWGEYCGYPWSASLPRSTSFPLSLVLEQEPHTCSQQISHPSMVCKFQDEKLGRGGGVRPEKEPKLSLWLSRLENVKLTHIVYFTLSALPAQ